MTELLKQKTKRFSRTNSSLRKLQKQVEKIENAFITDKNEFEKLLILMQVMDKLVSSKEFQTLSSQKGDDGVKRSLSRIEQKWQKYKDEFLDGGVGPTEIISRSTVKVKCSFYFRAQPIEFLKQIETSSDEIHRRSVQDAKENIEVFHRKTRLLIEIRKLIRILSIADL